MLSYAELREAAGRMSTLLAAAGVAPGDRVGIMLPNVPAFPIAFYHRGVDRVARARPV